MPKKYTVREVLEDGEIKTVGKFQEYGTLEDAKEAINYIIENM